MSRVRIYARNLLANWVGYLANIVVAFCLAPFVLGNLGDEMYGVWVVLSSLTGYLGLIEMGTQAGLGRYVNYYLGRNETDKANAILNTALAFFLVAGVLLVGVSAGLGMAFPALFPKVSPEFVPSARLALLLVAINLWMSFLGAAFGQVLTAFERFDISNGIHLVVLAVRTVGTVLVLGAGGGIIRLAAVQVGSSVVGVVGGWLCARRVFTGMRIRTSELSMARFKELFGFGLWAFLGQIAMRLMYWTDEIVILALIGPTQVTMYAFPLMLVQYGREIVDRMAGILGPQTIKASSVGDYQELRRILGWGSKIIMYLAIPLFLGMSFFGTEFFLLWLPQRQGLDWRVSGSVLILLAVPQLFVMGVRPCVNIINGLGYVRFGALITLGQGVVNLALSLAFVIWLHWGLHGVALGTLVPAVVFNCVVVAFVLKWIRFPARGFLTNNVLRWLVATVVFGAICQGVAMLPGKEVWAWFGLKVIALIAICVPLGWVVIFTRGERAQLRSRIASLLPRRKGDARAKAEVE